MHVMVALALYIWIQKHSDFLKPFYLLVEQYYTCVRVRVHFITHVGLEQLQQFTSY